MMEEAKMDKMKKAGQGRKEEITSVPYGYRRLTLQEIKERGWDKVILNARRIKSEGR